ncbi:MAG: formimidoylglutamate deiminase [Gemmatimonadetes bacterium]|nr:formimidoylglutamate deiminase [Gemmatimonadota bacterium]
MPTLIPDLLYHDGEFRRGLAVSFSARTGRITQVGPAAASKVGLAGADGSGDGARIHLRDRALLPGFVNAHSHAFQRLLRGRAQWRPGGTANDFWSWRRAMYETVNAITPDELFEVSRFCFIEMLAAGITSVGEFHYVHRDAQGRPYDNPAELAQRVIAAAEDAGIRICLLRVAYACGGVGEPLMAEQRRFATPDLDDFLSATIDLAHAAQERPLVTLGIAPHSLRAVPREWLRPIHALAFGYALPFHIHVSEQPAEVTACLQAWGKRPVEVLADEGVIDEHLTAVHATHLTFREVGLLGHPGPTVCACPTTERDLGDGFLPALELVESGARLALGTDSQTVIDLFEDMRLVEYHERLRRLRRVVLAPDEEGARNTVAPRLLAMATAHGARALRSDAGRIRPQAPADLVAVDLNHRALAGWTDETLDACLALTAPAAVVSDVWVGGVQRIGAGRHRLDEESAAAFQAVARRVMT